MLKRICYIGLLVVFTSCLLPLAGEREACARESHYSAENITCVSSVEVEFPLKLNFTLSAESDTEITDIRLHYRINRESFAQVTSEVFIKLTPDTTINAQWSWDMRKTGGLPPGTVIKYWWTVKDSGGNKVETDPTTVRFDDNRYDWQSITEGKLTIYWYEGDKSFAGELMSSAQQALVRLEEDTGAYLKNPAEIHIYANSNDLQGAMVFPQEWTGGVAFTLYNIIAIGIEPFNIAWGKRAMSHELTHLVIHQMVLNPYIGLPTWLDEGLAMHTEGMLSSGLAARLDKAITGDSLISVRSLSSPFSTDPETAYLSYAQSYSLVEFLINVYGQGKMLEMLTTFSEGSGYDEALEKVYGFDMDGLDTLWQDYITGHHRTAGVKNTTTVSVSTGTLIMPDAALPSGLLPTARSRAWRWN